MCDKQVHYYISLCDAFISIVSTEPTTSSHILPNMVKEPCSLSQTVSTHDNMLCC